MTKESTRSLVARVLPLLAANLQPSVVASFATLQDSKNKSMKRPCPSPDLTHNLLSNTIADQITHKPISNLQIFPGKEKRKTEALT